MCYADLSDKWLSDPRLEHLEYKQRYFVVEIYGTRGNSNHPRWFEGEHENKKGIVVTVIDRGGGFNATATLKMFDDDDEEEEEEELIVPIVYLRPVKPVVGDLAVPLDMTLPDSQPLEVKALNFGQCELYSVPAGTIYILEDKVCKYQEW